MKLFFSFLKLIRWPNLVFIILTQFLFKYCVIDKLFFSSNLHSSFSYKYFLLLALASVLIAAAGYIINDYFDIDIDQVNKPENLVVDKIISRRWAILLHLLLSAVGLVLSVVVAFKTNLLIAPANICCVLLLWFYSTTFKKKLLSGNIIISLLTAWVIMVIYFAVDGNFPFHKFDKTIQLNIVLNKILKLAILYTVFAFIISLVREVVKDMEDMYGDSRFGGRTMPIVWGIPVSKVFSGVWLVVLAGALAILQFYVMQQGWWLASLYCTVFIIAPVIYITKKLYDGRLVRDYHTLSSYIKLVMFTGILSMLLFRMYLA